jgi:Tol biopolymer transport system component
MLFALRGNKTLECWCYIPGAAGTPPGQDNSPPHGAMELLIAEGTDCADPRLSFGGDRVAFTKTGNNGHVQVFSAPSDGSGNALELTALEGECRNPVWSPAPQDDRLAFVYEPEDSGAQLAVVSSQGGQVARLVKELGSIGTVAWSPDGKRLVFDADSGNWTQLWRYSFSDSSLQVLTTPQADHLSPVFASDTVIVFTLEPSDGPSQIGKVYQYAPDTALSGNLVWVETTLTNSAYDHANPCVAGSAGQVFFEVESYDGNTMIGRVALGGGSEAILTSGESDFELPTTGPEGETLYCLRSSDGGAAISEVYADARGYEDKTDDAVERESPHARQDAGGSACAAYVRDGSIYRTLGQGEGGGQGGTLGVFSL